MMSTRLHENTSMSRRPLFGRPLFQSLINVVVATATLVVAITAFGVWPTMGPHGAGGLGPQTGVQSYTRSEAWLTTKLDDRTVVTPTFANHGLGVWSLRADFTNNTSDTITTTFTPGPAYTVIENGTAHSHPLSQVVACGASDRASDGETTSGATHAVPALATAMPVAVAPGAKLLAWTSSAPLQHIRRLPPRVGAAGGHAR